MGHPTLATAFTSTLTPFYTAGLDLRGVPLKNYTSGDGTNEGFEQTVTTLVETTMAHFAISPDRYRISGDYFAADDPTTQDPQRMDTHLWVDGKVVAILESRAWVDKPFYTLKRAVIRNMMELPYVKRHLAKDVAFLIVALNIDIMPRLVSTLDSTMGHGDRVSAIALSHGRRDSKTNYFDRGLNPAAVTTLADQLARAVAPYSTGCACAPSPATLAASFALPPAGR